MIKVTAKKACLIFKRALPNKDMRRCPAIRLAVSRTHRVMGRIKFLVISISTMKAIRATGVPWGSR